MSFGELLQQTRVRARVNLRDLGKAVGLSAIYLSEIERGNRRPPALPIVEEIASALNVDPEPLLEAAMTERDALELPLSQGSAREAKLDLSLALTRVWDDMDDSFADDLKEFIRKRQGEKR